MVAVGVRRTHDAIAWYAARIERVLREHRPQLHVLDWDAACRERRYAGEDPNAVVQAPTRVSDALADLLDDLDDARSRAGIGSDCGERTVLALGRRAAHEGVHHLRDIRRQISAPRSTI